MATSNTPELLNQILAEIPNAHLERLKLVDLLRTLHTVKKLPYTETELRTMLDLLDYIRPMVLSIT